MHRSIPPFARCPQHLFSALMKTFRRTINAKFAICLLGALAMLSMGSYVLHGYQIKRHASILVEQAERAEKQGQLPKAIDYLRRYLALAPQSHDALAKYGMLLADPKIATTPRALQQAYLVLEQSLRRDPERQDIRRRIVRLALDKWLDRPSDALEHLNKLAPDQDAELLSLRARCHTALRDFPKARADYQ